MIMIMIMVMIMPGTQQWLPKSTEYFQILDNKRRRSSANAHQDFKCSPPGNNTTISTHIYFYLNFVYAATFFES